MTPSLWIVYTWNEHEQHYVQEYLWKGTVTYQAPRDQQTAKRKQKASTEEWIKSEDGITETMTGPNGVYTRFNSCGHMNEHVICGLGKTRPLSMD